MTETQPRFFQTNIDSKIIARQHEREPLAEGSTHDLYTKVQLDALMIGRSFNPTGRGCLDLKGRVFAREYEKDTEKQWCILRSAEGIDESAESIQRRFEYVISKGSGDIEVVEKFILPCEEAVQLDQELDQDCKAVTARGYGSYSTELELDEETIFGKRAGDTPPAVTVAGDPYCMIDIEGATLLDYEFVDEIFPALDLWFEQELRNINMESGIDEYDAMNNIGDRFRSFWCNLHRGNDEALRRRYSDEEKLLASSNWWSEYTDPAILLRNEIVNEIGMLLSELFQTTIHPDMEADFKESIVLFRKKINSDFQRKVRDLLDNTWQVADYEHMVTGVTGEDIYRNFPKPQVGSETYSAEMENPNIGKEWLVAHYQHDQDRKKDSSDIQDLKDVIAALTSALERYSTGASPDQVSTLTSLAHRLNALKKDADSFTERTNPRRADILLFSMARIYETLNTLVTGLEDKDLLRQPASWVASNKIFELFPKEMHDKMLFLLEYGDIFSVPGMNGRVRTYLNELVDFARRTETYVNEIWSRRQNEMRRLDDLKVPLDPDIRSWYLDRLERPLREEYLHKIRTQRAIPVHGFFPDSVPMETDSQDRIVALYSISTHLWDSYRTAQQFEEHISKAIKFLKPGGKLVVGPINYRQIRAIKANDRKFLEKQSNAPLLLQALQTLHDEGILRFEFLMSDESTIPYTRRLHNEEESEQRINQLKDKFSSPSLVITRLS